MLKAFVKYLRIIPFFILFLSFSCSDENCDNDVIDINKKYENIYNLAAGDKDHQNDIIMEMFAALNDSCTSNSCGERVSKINDEYEVKINLVAPGSEQQKDVIAQMWLKINLLDCYN